MDFDELIDFNFTDWEIVNVNVKILLGDISNNPNIIERTCDFSEGMKEKNHPEHLIVWVP